MTLSTSVLNLNGCWLVTFSFLLQFLPVESVLCRNTKFQLQQKKFNCKSCLQFHKTKKLYQYYTENFNIQTKNFSHCVYFACFHPKSCSPSSICKTSIHNAINNHNKISTKFMKTPHFLRHCL